MIKKLIQDIKTVMRFGYKYKDYPYAYEWDYEWQFVHELFCGGMIDSLPPNVPNTIWLDQNIGQSNYKFYPENVDDEEEYLETRYILFRKESDCMAFKLRWL